MSEVFFSTDLCRHHTFCGGVSRVDRAMAERTRSRSPTRVPDETAKKEAPKVPPEVLELKGADEDEKLSEGKPVDFQRRRSCPKLHWLKQIRKLLRKVPGVSSSPLCWLQPKALKHAQAS